MAPFKFPPPPPPPPKAAPSEQPYSSQRGDHTRGGGDRGRGRGGGQNRGGGFNSSGGNPRGGYGQNRGRGDARGRGGQRGGYQNNRGGGNQRGGFNAGNGQLRTNAPPNAGPTNVHVNPTFMGNAPVQDQTQQQVDPNALAQVMSFMSTTAGVQSMAAFASQMTSSGNAVPSYPQSPPPQYNQPTPRYSPPQHAGQKRKLDDRNQKLQPHRKPPQPSPKPPRAKAAVPPPIPSFGFSLPPPVVVKPDVKKRAANLGLSQKPKPEESSDEEDVDEEVVYQEKLKGGGFAFEHEGEMIAIRTGAEVAAWIKDRRKNFPTQERIMEKADEAASKRMSELDFLRRLKGKPPKKQSIETQVPVQQTKPRERSKEDQAKHEADIRRKQEAEAKRQEELAALRKKLHESMMKKQSAPVDLGLGYDSATASDEESEILSESSVVSSSEEEEEPDPESSDESDAAPEPTSSKMAAPPIRVAPPQPPPRAPPKPETRTCTNWARNGRCPWLSKCKYQHPPKKEEELKLEMGLYERMVEQELIKADQLALDAIKYLGQNGFLG